MASHFECIGLDPVDRAAFVELMDRLIREGSNELRPDGGDLIHWIDPSGATVAYNVDPTGRIECVTPSFRGPSRLQARLERFADHPQCPFCTPMVAHLVDASGAAAVRMALQLDDIGVWRPRLSPERPMTLSVSAFAEVLETWRDADAFRERQPGAQPEAFVPSGLVSPDGRPRPPEPRATITGVVLDAERRVNEATGRGFTTARLRTCGGVVDLLAATYDAPKGFAPGSVVRASCWLVGHVLEG